MSVTTPDLSSNKIGTFALAMSTFILVTALNNVPAAAEFGTKSIFFFGLAGVTMLIPSVLIPGELGPMWRQDSGMYKWVTTALGPRAGFMAIWFQWLIHIIILPSIVAYIAATAAIAFNPDLAQNEFYLFGVIMVVIWVAVGVSMRGVQDSVRFATGGAIVAIVLPATLLIVFAVVFVATGGASQIDFTTGGYIPDFGELSEVSFAGTVFVGFIGLEVTANFMQDIHEPRRTYRRALAIAAIASLIVMVPSALSVAIAVPQSDLGLASGVIEAFRVYGSYFGISWIVPILAAIIAVATIGQGTSFIVGPAMGMLSVSEHHALPTMFTKLNRRGAPSSLLAIEGLIATVIGAIFLLTPSVNAAFSLVLQLVVEMYLVGYLLMYVSVLVLKYKRPDIERPRPIPGGLVGAWIVVGGGSVAALAIILVGFVPPAQIEMGNPILHALILVGGFAVGAAAPFLLKSMRHRYPKPPGPPAEWLAVHAKGNER